MSGAVLLERNLLCILSIVVLLSLFPSSLAEGKCSRTCLALNCDTFSIRYGKYCGVGHTGCAGEKPCDDVDACCKLHDECTEFHGIVGAECHEKMKKCLKKAQRSGKTGFSKECPYSTVIPTMITDCKESSIENMET